MDGKAMSKYDPFARGSFPVGVRTFEARDAVRNRLFPVEIWYPAAGQYAGEDLAPDSQDGFPIPARDEPRKQLAVRNAAEQPGIYPLVVFSHGSASGARRMSTFICTHLSSHGYVVAALYHSEVIAPELARRDGETDEQKTARVEALIASRVPDVRFLLDYLLDTAPRDSEMTLDPTRIGIVGYSFGGWTVLAATAVEWRIRAVVALAPGGSSRPKPGILPGKLSFAWGRDVPTLYLVAENDVMTPLAGMHELFDRTPATKRMVILRRADHIHFLDDVEREHEATRNMKWAGTLAWISEEMRPVAELCSGEQAHLFVRGLTLGHMDDVLRGREEARHFWAADIQTALAALGVDGIAYQR
jgi:dienelactone hydrolase